MAADETLSGALVAVADLGEHLLRAREVLRLPPFVPDRAPEGDRPHVARILDVAQTAVAALGAYVQGLRRSFAAGAAIELTRTGNEVQVIVIGAPAAAEIAGFIDELRVLDQRLLSAAALLGLLLHLCTSWVGAGFAAPLLLKSLLENGPRILELGAELISS